MAVRSGFWNSAGTDIRTYYNHDFSHLISLLITDGIHKTYGEHFHTIAGSGLQVIVKTGEAWFNDTWIRNDSDLQVNIDTPPVVSGFKRLDAIAIKIDATVPVRDGTIEYLVGTPTSETPSIPSMEDTDEVHWHLLSTVLVQANDTAITNDRITDYVGTSRTPYIIDEELDRLLATKVDKVAGKGLSSNDFTTALLNKLNGIESGAQVNKVTSVAGKTGAVSISKSDVGLGNVDNTADANKHVLYANSAGSATSADKCNYAGTAPYLCKGPSDYSGWSVGGQTRPVYFYGGVPYLCSDWFNQDLKTSANVEFNSVGVRNEVIKSTSGNIQVQGASDNSSCYLRAGSVEVVYVSSLEKRPIYASSFVVGSSRRIKENITDMSEEEARKILDVDVVDFDYIKDVGGEKNCHGVIAEDVKEIIPFAVTVPEEDDGKRLDKVPSVDYSKFTPYLIKMVQIQQSEIDNLRSEVEELRTLIKGE